MLFHYTLFLFIAFGSKLVLALLMIYMLLPTERSCNSCDEETLLIRSTGLSRWMMRLSGGRLQRRWCPRCDWYGYSRRIALHPEVPARPVGEGRSGRGGRARPSA